MTWNNVNIGLKAPRDRYTAHKLLVTNGSNTFERVTPPLVTPYSLRTSVLDYVQSLNERPRIKDPETENQSPQLSVWVECVRARRFSFFPLFSFLALYDHENIHVFLVFIEIEHVLRNVAHYHWTN